MYICIYNIINVYIYIISCVYYVHIMYNIYTCVRAHVFAWYTGTWTRGKQIDTQGHEEAFAEALEACDLLTRAPKDHLKCCSFVDIVDFDFRPIHEACEDVREHARDPHSSKLYHVTLRAARMCHDNIYPNFKNGMEFGFQNSGNFCNCCTHGPAHGAECFYCYGICAGAPWI